MSSGSFPAAVLTSMRRGFISVLCALGLAGVAKAEDSIPPELAALHAKAENGNAIAQYNLGLAYLNGDGVTADLSEAFVWLTLAKEQGTTGKQLNTLVAQMTPDAVAEGNRRLALERSAIAAAAPAKSGVPVYSFANETAPPVKEVAPQPEAQVQPSLTPTPSPDLVHLEAKTKALQQIIDQLNATNQQLTSQLDERSQALLQAVAQVTAIKNLQDGQDSAKAEELAAAHKAVETANAALETAKKEDATQVAALQKSLADTSIQVADLQAKLASDDAALKATGDAGAKTQELNARLQNDL